MTTLEALRTNPQTAAAPRRPGLSPWLAGLWSVTYPGLAGLHLVRDTGAPWVPTPASVLGSLSSTDVSVLIVVALVLADARSLTFLGYFPMLLLGAVGVGPAGDVAMSVLAPALTSVGESVGGLALLLTGVSTLRTGRSAWTPQSAARACRWAVAVAVAVPAFYASTRLAWALDIPLGVRDVFLVELGSAKFAGLGLALAAFGGCLLTIGLVRRWGEVFWSWLPVIGGRPVPVRMALVPAVFVGSVVFSAGLAFWRLVLMGEVNETPGEVADWAAWVPELFWPLWGVALAVAGLAYAARRASEDR